MVVITVQAYSKARVLTIKVGNRELFWVKMIDFYKGLGLKHISHLVRKQKQGMYETKYPTEEQKRKYIRTEEELTKQDTDDSKYKYVRSDLMEKIRKSRTGVKQCNDGVNRLEKTKHRKSFRTILGFKEHGIMNVTRKITLDSINNAFEGEIYKLITEF